MKYLSVLIFFSFVVTCNSIFAQCTDGTQNSCKCSTALVMFSAEELDGYVLPMSSYAHSMDGPNPLCSGQGGVPNNPTWLAFQAWNTDISLLFKVNNCTGQGGSNGIQMAIYSDCDTYTPVACNVSPANCNLEDKALTMTGLVVGATYYLVVDGCAGSFCDVTIDVISGLTPKVIGSLEQISGATEVCKGTKYKYSIPVPSGTEFWHWTVDGDLIEDSLTASNTIDIVFDELGTSEVCVDVSNIWVDVNSAPLKKCIDVVVTDSLFPVISKEVLICPGDSIILGGVYYIDGQIFVDTLKSGEGCNIIRNHIVKKYVSPINNLGDIFICKDECYSIKGNGVPPIVFCDTITNASAVIPSYIGCDSMIMLNIRRGYEKSDTSFQLASLCYKDTISFNNVDITMSGDYKFVNNFGDSCQVIILSVQDFSKAPDIEFSKCDNESLTYSGQVYTSPGVYMVEVLNPGCRKIQKLTIEDKPSYLNLPCILIETNSPIIINGITVTQTTILKINLKTVDGCDSVVCYDIQFPNSTSEDGKNVKVDLIPNPVKNSLQILTELPVEINGWQVFNPLGQMLLKSNTNSYSPFHLDVSTLSSGLYYWKGLVNGQQVLRQFMKIK